MIGVRWSAVQITSPGSPLSVTSLAYKRLLASSHAVRLSSSSTPRPLMPAFSKSIRFITVLANISSVYLSSYKYTRLSHISALPTSAFYRHLRNQHCLFRPWILELNPVQPSCFQVWSLLSCYCRCAQCYFQTKKNVSRIVGFLMRRWNGHW